MWSCWCVPVPLELGNSLGGVHPIRACFPISRECGRSGLPLPSQPCGSCCFRCNDLGQRPLQQGAVLLSGVVRDAQGKSGQEGHADEREQEQDPEARLRSLHASESAPELS